MNLVIANVSTQIPHAAFRAAVRAIQNQVTNHFKPEWGLGAAPKPITIPLAHRKAPIQKNADAILYLGDSSSDPNTGVKDAYGYHAANNKGIPYGFVYLDICASSKESWTCTLSHEVLELLGDPDAVLTVTGPSPKSAAATVYYDLEMCDPTQGDTYKIAGIVVSNFVGRRYFGMSGGSGHTNHLNQRLRLLRAARRLPAIRTQRQGSSDLRQSGHRQAKSRQKEDGENTPQCPPRRSPFDRCKRLSQPAISSP